MRIPLLRAFFLLTLWPLAPAFGADDLAVDFGKVSSKASWPVFFFAVSGDGSAQCLSLIRETTIFVHNGCDEPVVLRACTLLDAAVDSDLICGAGDNANDAFSGSAQAIAPDGYQQLTMPYANEVPADATEDDVLGEYFITYSNFCAGQSTLGRLQPTVEVDGRYLQILSVEERDEPYPRDVGGCK